MTNAGSEAGDVAGRPVPRLSILIALSILTLGLYWLYWVHTTDRNLRRDFQLARDPAGSLLLVLGVLFVVPLFVFFWRAAEGLSEAHRKAGLRTRLTPSRYVSLSIVPAVAVAAAIVGSILVFRPSLAAMDAHDLARRIGYYRAMMSVLLGMALVAALAMVVWHHRSVTRLARARPA